MNSLELAAVVAACEFDPWDITIRFEDDGAPYLQVCDVMGVCNMSGQPNPWAGRKWRLSYHMTESEVVKTALKAVLAAAEHEALEQFKYKGETIFDPHINVDDLLRLRHTRPLDRRT